MTAPLGTGFKSVLYLNWTGGQIQTGLFDVDQMKKLEKDFETIFFNKKDLSKIICSIYIFKAVNIANGITNESYYQR